MKRVIVHIDSLVLKGFRHEDRHAVAQGLQQELERLLARADHAGNLTARDRVSRLRLQGVRVDNGASPQSIGTQVARVIVRGD